MPSDNRSRVGSVAVPLSIAVLLAVLPGCAKVNELLGKGGEGEAAAGTTGGEAAAAEEAKAEEPPVEVAPVEEIPEQVPVTGLDAMFQMVTAPDANYVIIRDAQSLIDYVEEAGRFVEAPIKALAAATPESGLKGDISKMEAGWADSQKASSAVLGAIKAASIKLDQGLVIADVKKGKKSVIVFAGDNPNALVDVLKAVDAEKGAKFTCKKLDKVAGYNACSDDKKTLEGYDPSGDPKAVRAKFEENLTGVDLEKTNILAHIADDGEAYVSVLTTPGVLTISVGFAKAPKEFAQLKDVLSPGEAKVLSSVQPGAGFIWARTDIAKLQKTNKDLKNLPPPFDNLATKLSGEWLVGGSVDPPAFMIQAGITDPAAFAGLVDMAMVAKDQVPKEIPDIKGSKLVYEKIQVAVAGQQVDAVHVGATGMREADVLAKFTGMHLNGWMFAANNVATVAIGPDADNVGKLAEGSGGPSADTLAALPPLLAEGFKQNQVSFVAHLPFDALQGPEIRNLVKASLKNMPAEMMSADQIDAGLGLMAPLSTATLWITQPGDKPLVHYAVQGIGNRATNEGKAALDAAHSVVGGADPATAFSSMAATYANSPRVSSYKARAGGDVGSLVGSGVGAIAATAAIAVPIALGVRNEALAEELGIEPEPEPEKKIAKKTTRKKKPDKKSDDKKGTDPDPDPIVEPPTPTPDPVPTPTPDPDPDPDRKGPLQVKVPKKPGQ